MNRTVIFAVLCMLSYVPFLGSMSLLLLDKSALNGLQHPRTENLTANYFPANVLGSYTNFFSEYLYNLGEPSLFNNLEETGSVSYRLDFWSGQHGRFIVVRLSLKRDSRAEITTIEKSGSPVFDRQAHYSPSDAQCQTFLKMVEVAKFWSMPSVEEKQPSGAPRSYRIDASNWVFEGVREGKYHVVIRETPDPSSFTEMVRFLAKDLGKLDESVIPRTFPAKRLVQP